MPEEGGRTVMIFTLEILLSRRRSKRRRRRIRGKVAGITDRWR